MRYVAGTRRVTSILRSKHYLFIYLFIYCNGMFRPTHSTPTLEPPTSLAQLERLPGTGSRGSNPRRDLYRLHYRPGSAVSAGPRVGHFITRDWAPDTEYHSSESDIFISIFNIYLP